MTLSRLFLCEKNVIILLSYRNHSCSRQAFCLTPSSQGAKPSYEAQMPSYMIKFRSSLPPHMGSLYTPHKRGTSHLQENTLFRVHTTSHQIVLHSQNSIQGSNSKALLHPPPRERGRKTTVENFKLPTTHKASVVPFASKALCTNTEPGCPQRLQREYRL